MLSLRVQKGFCLPDASTENDKLELRFLKANSIYRFISYSPVYRHGPPHYQSTKVDLVGLWTPRYCFLQTPRLFLRTHRHRRGHYQFHKVLIERTLHHVAIGRGKLVNFESYPNHPERTIGDTWHRYWPFDFSTTRARGRTEGECFGPIVSVRPVLERVTLPFFLLLQQFA